MAQRRNNLKFNNIRLPKSLNSDLFELLFIKNYFAISILSELLSNSKF